jgi:hypothetical protein
MKEFWLGLKSQAERTRSFTLSFPQVPIRKSRFGKCSDSPTVQWTKYAAIVLSDS